MNRRELLLSAAGLPEIPAWWKRARRKPPRRALRDSGWCWDGQAINGQWQLSVFGMGEGTQWFDLQRCCCMFHPNSPMTLDRLAGMKEVVCDISKWDYRRVDAHEYEGLLSAPVRMFHDARIERKMAEAEMVSHLSLSYPNVSGAIDDDLFLKIKSQRITPDQYFWVYSALHSANPYLKLWGVVYSHELQKEAWAGFADLLDVVTLWVWASKDLVNLDRYVDQCQEIFPGKPINLGCYLRDYTLLEGVPMPLLEHQWEFVATALREGTIQSYSILGGFLIDMHEEQAFWVRDFILQHDSL